MSAPGSPLLVLGATDLEALLPPAVCIAAVEAAMTAASSGEAVLPLRTSTNVTGTTGRLILMPCVLGSADKLAVESRSPIEREYLELLLLQWQRFDQPLPEHLENALL